MAAGVLEVATIVHDLVIRDTARCGADQFLACRDQAGDSGTLLAGGQTLVGVAKGPKLCSATCCPGTTSTPDPFEAKGRWALSTTTTGGMARECNHQSVR